MYIIGQSPILQPRDLFECRGLGQDEQPVPSGTDWGAMLQGFFTQQFGPLPLWAWTGGALLLWSWLFTPGGSEYREKSRRLREEHTGIGRIRRRGKRVSSGLKAAIK